MSLWADPSQDAEAPLTSQHRFHHTTAGEAGYCKRALRRIGNHHLSRVMVGFAWPKYIYQLMY